MRKKMSLKKFSSRKDLQAHSCFLAGAGRVEPPITESKSVALPLGDAPMKSDSIGLNEKKKMGRVVGLEPTRNGATIRRVNHFTTPAIFSLSQAFRHMTLFIVP